MPASVFSLVRVLVLYLAINPIILANASAAEPSSTMPALNSALRWLSTNQTSSGSYGDYFEHWAASAAYALWLNDSNSPKAALSYSWLASQMDNPTSWFWGQYGEADVPGAVVQSIAASQNLGLITTPEVASRILEFEEPSGGFRGYYGAPSGADTALALRGLAEAQSINNTSRQSAIDYLFTLQNSDGSFNLTTTIAYDPIYSLGPEPVSMTALVVLSLGAVSFSVDDGRVRNALNFLTTAISRNFTATGDEKGHVYSASLTALALNVFGRTSDASEVVPFIVSQQNSDGGFSDSARASKSNALDTGWAAVALQLVQPASVQTPALNPVIISAIIATAAVMVAAILAAIVLYSRKRGRMGPSIQ